MAAITRAALQDSPLADLHSIAAEFGIEGYRRMRKADLIDALLKSQGIVDEAPAVEDDAGDEPETELDLTHAGPDGGDRSGARRERSRSRSRGGRGRRGGGRDAADDAEYENGDSAPREEEVVEGVVELLGNGSGFLRMTPPEPSDDDVYISAAQVRRCELVSGDRVSGPARPPRRSERYPSLVRIDTIDGRPADEVAQGTRFDDLPCAFPDERIELGSEDDTLKAIDSLAPLGKGSRAVIYGGPHSGKSAVLSSIAAALSKGDAEVSVVLAGVRPEEIGEWKVTGVEPVAALPFTASAEAQTQAIGACIDSARRIAARGGDPVVLIDTLDGLSPSTARRLLGSGRNIVDGGSLTVIATASQPVGGETTLIALDTTLARAASYPALKIGETGTLSVERLVGKTKASAIRKARS